MAKTSSVLALAGRLALVGVLTVSSTARAARADVVEVVTTIQAAVDAASPGDTVRVPPGVYAENVLVTKDDVTIEGSAGAILDGAGLDGNTGITARPAEPDGRISGFVLSGMEIRNFSRNGVRLDRVDDFRVERGTYVDNLAYGIFPVRSTNGTVAFNEVSGSDDAGIYVGQSENVVVERNRTVDNTVGFEIENSSHVTVRKNVAIDNSAGILVFVLPLLAVKETSDVQILDNTLKRNNRPNPVTNPEEILAALPSGIGFANIGGDAVVVERNVASRNRTAGFAALSLPPPFAALDAEVDPAPDGNSFRKNRGAGNGEDPDPQSPLPGGDLVWDGSGSGNCWRANRLGTRIPASLPKCL